MTSKVCFNLFGFHLQQQLIKSYVRVSMYNLTIRLFEHVLSAISSLLNALFFLISSVSGWYKNND